MGLKGLFLARAQKLKMAKRFFWGHYIKTIVTLILIAVALVLQCHQSTMIEKIFQKEFQGEHMNGYYKHRPHRNLGVMDSDFDPNNFIDDI